MDRYYYMDIQGGTLGIFARIRSNCIISKSSVAQKNRVKPLNHYTVGISKALEALLYGRTHILPENLQFLF